MSSPLKALERCLDLLARVLERYHGNLPRFAPQNVFFAIVGILHLIEKPASARNELFHVDPRLRRHRQRREDASDGGMNSGEKHRYPHAEPQQRKRERMPHPEFARGEERDEESASHSEAQPRQVSDAAFRTRQGC